MKKEVKLRYSAGRTLNTGNYESARFEVSVELTCLEDDIDGCYDRAKDFVDEKIEENTKQVRL